MGHISLLYARGDPACTPVVPCTYIYWHTPGFLDCMPLTLYGLWLCHFISAFCQLLFCFLCKHRSFNLEASLKIFSEMISFISAFPTVNIHCDSREVLGSSLSMATKFIHFILQIINLDQRTPSTLVYNYAELPSFYSSVWQKLIPIRKQGTNGLLLQQYPIFRYLPCILFTFLLFSCAKQ